MFFIGFCRDRCHRSACKFLRCFQSRTADVDPGNARILAVFREQCCSTLAGPKVRRQRRTLEFPCSTPCSHSLGCALRALCTHYPGSGLPVWYIGCTGCTVLKMGKSSLLQLRPPVATSSATGSATTQPMLFGPDTESSQEARQFLFGSPVPPSTLVFVQFAHQCCGG